MAATKVARDSISDDWEDVGDDNLSVRSLPTSDDGRSAISEPEVLSTSQTTLPIRSVAHSRDVQPTPDFVSETTTLNCNDNPPPCPSKSEGKFDEIDTEQGHGQEKRMADEQPHNSPHCDHEGSVSARTAEKLVRSSTTSDSVEADIILNLARESESSLRENIEYLRNLPSLDGKLAETAVIMCKLLAEQVRELIPILAGYAKVWSKYAGDIPLDPGLNEWLQGLNLQVDDLLQALQSEAEIVRILQEENVDQICADRGMNQVLQEATRILDHYVKQMNDFLPIMQVDFNEFQTKGMIMPIMPPSDASQPSTPTPASPIDIPNRPRGPVASSPTTGRPPATTPLRPSEDIWLLRRGLYHLSDVLKRAVTDLKQCASSGSLQSSRRALASDVARHCEALSSTVSLLLSNHGSDWIEHGLSGGLTYAEFAQINAGCILDFAAQLEYILDDVWIGELLPPRVNRDYRSDLDPGAGRKGVKASENDTTRPRPDGSLREAHLEQLEALAQILTATLSPDRT